LRAVIFDFDGVIVDTEPLHLAALNAVLKAHGLTCVPREKYYAEMLGLDDAGLFRTAYGQMGVEISGRMLQDLIAEKSRHYLGYFAGAVPVLPGTRQFISSVSRGCVLAVCSGALRHEIEFILERASLRGYFAVIVAAEDVSRGKPDPEGYLLACRRLNEYAGLDGQLRPQQCLVVEDSRPGIAAAKAAGMKCLAVASSHPPEELADADLVVPSLEEVSIEQVEALFR